MNDNIIRDKFLSLYENPPLLVRSPGRINLIGEHTDYNEGFVLPAAIDKEMVLAVAKNNSDQCNFYSYDYKQHFSTALTDLKPAELDWPNYLIGVLDQFIKGGFKLGGIDCVFGSDIPIGAGLSSSAALECGMAFAINKLFDLNVDKKQLIHFAQKAEHEFAGVQCGIMDQFASVMGKVGHAIRLDCRTLKFNYLPINLQDYQIVLCNTQVKHSLASSEYNTRRKECEQGVAAVRKNHPEVKSLRDVTVDMLKEVKNILDISVYNRCLFIIKENQRLLLGCELLEKGDILGFGVQMYGSHEGLSKLYDVSCAELDFLVDCTKDKPFVAGARMMGGGFGGCTINLVAKDKKDHFISGIKDAYQGEFNSELEIYEVKITDGTTALLNGANGSLVNGEHQKIPMANE